MKSNKLFVGNLNKSITCEKLREIFSDYGEVRKADIIDDRGFGFVEMSDPADAERAMERLNGCELEDSIIKVEEARPPRYEVDAESISGVELLEEEPND